MKKSNLDLICLGRACVDFYGDQIGSRLEDMSSFSKYIGGSSCNIAFGSSRLGLRTAMLTRVGDDQMGRFVTETLVKEGCDVSRVAIDPERLTGLAVLGIKDKETFPLLYYRENCADMAISEDDFDEDFIASAKALVVTGTHFSTPSMYGVSCKALDYARKNDTKVVLDIDYRPVLWGTTQKSDGENRYVASARVTEHLQTILPSCDLIVGTEEEICMAGGCEDTINSLHAIRKISNAAIVVKRGSLGCSVFPDEIPGQIDAGGIVAGFNVDVLNLVGAGDAFMSGFLYGWIAGESYHKCCTYGNACGALVVSRHECSQAMPTVEELTYYLDNAQAIASVKKDKTLQRLHRVVRKVNRKNELEIFAFDHRKQLEDMARENGASVDQIGALKKLMVVAARRVLKSKNLEATIGVLIDDKYGQDALNDITGEGWWIARPVELPGSRPLEFEVGDNVAMHIQSWPKEHIVKCLVFYHPDDEEAMRTQQERKITHLYEACVASGHQLLLEVILPLDGPQEDDAVARALERFYALGVFPEWWKLPSPSRTGWQKIESVIQKNDPHCHGVVLLGLDAPQEELAAGFANSADADLCKGFAVGRTIFGAPARSWFSGDLDDEGFIKMVEKNYQGIIDIWRNRKAS